MTVPSPALTREDKRRARELDVTSTRTALRSFGRVKTEVLAGLVVALALIPEAVAFSVIVGVDPRFGCTPHSRWRSRSRSSADAPR